MLICACRVLREVTLVVTDVEGSTELWEWDYAVMTLAQEVHDSVMRSLIGR
jgi:class 3 adenylate cyclase